MSEHTRRDVLKWAGAAGALAMIPGCGSGDGGSGGSGGGTSSIEPFRGPTSSLRPFVPSDKVGAKPNLPKRIAYANASSAQFLVALGDATKKAADDRGLEYLTAVADSNAARQVEQINTFLQRGVCGLGVMPAGGSAVDQAKLQAIQQGVAVFGVVAPKASQQLIGDQAAIGRKQAELAVEFIRENLGGRAKVVYFNSVKVDPSQKIRHDAGIAVLRAAAPDIEVIVDTFGGLSPDEGFKTMNSILQAHPDFEVLVGNDTALLGAQQAIRSAGREDQVKYIGGIDGDAQALEEIKKGGAYKVSLAVPYEVAGYGWGQHAADWIEGKSIPLVVALQVVALDSADAINRFRADMENPAPIYEDKERLPQFAKYLGSISYETRDGWVDYRA